MVLNGYFDPLRFDADVTLSNGGGTVLQESLDKGDVISAGFVNLCGVPLAETVSADALETQVIANDGKLLLNCAFCDGENQIFFDNAVPQTVILDVLSDDQGDSEDTPLSCFLFHNFKAETITITNDVTGAEFYDVADPQAQVSLQDKGGGDALIGATATESLFHGLDDFFVLLCGESLCFLVHSRLQKQKVRKIRRSSSFVCGVRLISA